MISELYSGKLVLVSRLTLIHYQSILLSYKNQSIGLQNKKDTEKQSLSMSKLPQGIYQ